MSTFVVQTLWVILKITDVYKASPKQFWEDLTVSLTILSPLFGFVAFCASRYKDQHKFLEFLERVLVALSLAIGVFAGLALTEFTHYNRLAETESENRVIALASQANKATNEALSGNKTLIEQGKTLLATQVALKSYSQEFSSTTENLRNDLLINGRATEIQELIAKMNSDDALAFDQLRTMTSFSSSAQQKMVQQAVEAVIESHNVPSYEGSNPEPNMRGRFPPELNEMPVYLNDSSAINRELALKVLGAKYDLQKNLLPSIVHLAIADPSLGVRTLAVHLLGYWDNQRFTPLRTDIKTWWKSNRYNTGAPLNSRSKE